ncbi:MAG TPA: anthranilate synthase component I family protein [Planctomycetota bacterium]
MPVAPPAGATIPLLCFSYFSELLAYRAGEWWAVGPEVVPLAQPAGFLAGLASANSHRASGTGKRPQKGAGACQWHHAKSNFTRTAYVAAVDRALEYIAAGDIYQVNLAQRFTVPWEESAAELYLRLREQSPSDYGAFLGSALCGGAHTICSISPELFLNVNGETIITRPIKGTRPRGSASEAGRGAAGDAAGRDARARADCAARRSLERSEKERAELNMIVDLERNDLGHVCEYGSVRVVSPGEVETLPTLFHRVATIEGKLRASWTLSELLAATFPGGSVTGAPKIRAMQIISELERGARGPYCGAIGWLGGDRSLELSIAIRTAIVDERRKEVSYHAGSGIVADSVPQQEYEETLHKTAAFFRATAGFRVQGSGFGARRFSAKRNRQA